MPDTGDMAVNEEGYMKLRDWWERWVIIKKTNTVSQFSRFTVLIFYKVTERTGSMNAEPLPQWKYRVRFLGNSGHIFIN